MTARAIARYVAVALMGVAVLVATGDGFAQSYAGLFGWAVEHGLRGWKADSFPLMVDLFIAVGELGLFLLAIDGHRLRRSFMAWLDLLVPAGVAASGWGASLTFNVGHVAHDFATRATAAVPPLASMIGLLVLLRTLHRYVAQADTAAAPIAPPPGEVIELDAPAEASALDEEDEVLMAWLRGEDEVRVPEPPDLDRVRAAEIFRDEVRAGRTPSIRAIKKQLGVGQVKAKEVQAYLAYLAENQPEVVTAR